MEKQQHGPRWKSASTTRTGQSFSLSNFPIRDQSSLRSSCRSSCSPSPRWPVTPGQFDDAVQGDEQSHCLERESNGISVMKFEDAEEDLSHAVSSSCEFQLLVNNMSGETPTLKHSQRPKVDGTRTNGDGKEKQARRLQEHLVATTLSCCSEPSRPKSSSEDTATTKSETLSSRLALSDANLSTDRSSELQTQDCEAELLGNADHNSFVDDKKNSQVDMATDDDEEGADFNECTGVVLFDRDGNTNDRRSSQQYLSTAQNTNIPSKPRTTTEETGPNPRTWLKGSGKEDAIVIDEEGVWGRAIPRRSTHVGKINANNTVGLWEQNAGEANAPEDSIKDAIRQELLAMHIKNLPSDVRPIPRDPKTTSRSSSLYQGVSRSGLTWNSSVCFARVKYNLGYYESEHDAGAIYSWAQRIIRGLKAHIVKTSATKNGIVKQAKTLQLLPRLPALPNFVGVVSVQLLDAQHQQIQVSTLLPRPPTHLGIPPIHDQFINGHGKKTGNLQREDHESQDVRERMADSVAPSTVSEKEGCCCSKPRTCHSSSDEKDSIEFETDGDVGGVPTLQLKETEQSVSASEQARSRRQDSDLGRGQNCRSVRVRKRAASGAASPKKQPLSSPGARDDRRDTTRGGDLQHPSELLMPSCSSGELNCSLPMPKHPVVWKDVNLSNPIALQEDLTDRDIIFGRGAFSYRHSGNKRFRDLVMKYRSIYCALPKVEKRQMASNIVNYVRLQGGDFWNLSHRRSRLRRTLSGCFSEKQVMRVP